MKRVAKIPSHLYGVLRAANVDVAEVRRQLVSAAATAPLADAMAMARTAGQLDGIEHKIDELLRAQDEQ